MNKKIGLIIAAIALVCLAAVGVMGFKGGFGKEPGNSTVMQAIASGDYNAYVTALKADNRTKIMNSTQFDAFVQKYKESS